MLRIATLSATIIMTWRMNFLLWMISASLILRKFHITLMMFKRIRFLYIIKAKLRVLLRETTIFSTGDCLGIIQKNPYEIYIDFHFQPQPIRPQWFIDQLFADRYNDKSKNFESSANFLDTLSKQLSAKESTFIYELLQSQ